MTHTVTAEAPAPKAPKAPMPKITIDLAQTFRFTGDPPPIQKHFAKSKVTELLEEIEPGEGHGFPSYSNKESHAALQRVLSSKVKGIMKSHAGRKYVTRTEKTDDGVEHIMVYRTA